MDSIPVTRQTTAEANIRLVKINNNWINPDRVFLVTNGPRFPRPVTLIYDTAHTFVEVEMPIADVVALLTQPKPQPVYVPLNSLVGALLMKEEGEAHPKDNA